MINSGRPSAVNPSAINGNFAPGNTPHASSLRKFLFLLILVPLLMVLIFSLAAFKYGTPGIQVDKTQHGLHVSGTFAGHNPVLPGDLIIAIHGLPYTKVLGRLLLDVRSDGLSKDTLTVLRNGQTFTFTPAFTAVSWPLFLAISWPHLLLITLFLALGSIALLYATPGQPAVLFFSMLCGFATTIATTMPSHFGMLQPRIISLSLLGITLSNWFAFGAMAHFICRFPKERDLCKSRPMLAPVFYFLPPIIALGSAFLSAGFTADFFGGLQRFRNLSLPLIIIGSFLKHFVDLKHLHASMARNQVKLSLAAYGLTFVPYVALYLLPNLIFDYPLISFRIVLFAAVLLPAAYLIGLLRYRLLGVDRLISRSFAYGIVILLLALTYALLLALLKQWVFGPQVLSEGIFFIFMLLVALGMNPIINRIQKLIDRYFFRYRPDDNALLFDFSRKLASTLPLPELITLITRKLPKEMQLTRSAFLLIEEQTSRLYPARLRIESIRCPESALIRRLNQEEPFLFCGENQEDPDLNRELMELSGAGFSLALPLRGITRLTGVLLIGPRKDGRLFREHDVHLLAVLANQAALALSKSVQYTSLVRSKEQLEALFSRVVQSEKLAALGEISATLAHEIRNPLGIIRSSAQYLAEDRRPDDINQEMLHYIMDEVDGLNGVITNILGLAGCKNPNLKPVDLQQDIPLLLSSWRRSEDHNPYVRMDWSVEDRLPLLYADLRQLRQVLLNLIQNSEDAMKNGGTLFLRVEKEQECALFHLLDSGPGLPEGNPGELFRKFFTTKQDGVGLGLSVCEQIIRAHGGSITLRNRQGGGAEAMIRLPFQPMTGPGPDLNNREKDECVQRY